MEGGVVDIRHLWMVILILLYYFVSTTSVVRDA
jgi:hypothetical protein